jgi:hypothetical protein
MNSPGREVAGQRIARARRRRGLSQAVLAGLVGRSELWLSQIERGKRGVDSYSVLVRWVCGHRRIVPITQCHCVACRSTLPSCCAADAWRTFLVSLLARAGLLAVAARAG